MDKKVLIIYDNLTEKFAYRQQYLLSQEGIPTSIGSIDDYSNLKYLIEGLPAFFIMKYNKPAQRIFGKNYKIVEWAKKFEW